MKEKHLRRGPEERPTMMTLSGVSPELSGADIVSPPFSFISPKRAPPRRGTGNESCWWLSAAGDRGFFFGIAPTTFYCRGIPRLLRVGRSPRMHKCTGTPGSRGFKKINSISDQFLFLTKLKFEQVILIFWINYLADLIERQCYH